MLKAKNSFNKDVIAHALDSPKTSFFWYNACNAVSIDFNVAVEWYEKLKKLYAEKQRFYHCFTHVQSLCDVLGECLDVVEELNVVVFSIFFHDCIYDPISKTNEQDSAKVWKEFAKTNSIKEAVISDVVEIIIQTQHHMQCDPLASKDDKLLFLDMDLSILGMDEEAYKKYSECNSRFLFS